MGLFEQFPYQNFHELNLDWLINEIKKLGDSAVLSVNGQTGDVILYQSENIVFPEVESNQWRMVRTADGHTAGVMFQNGLMYVMFDNTAERVYTVDHPPAYPVTSVDGQTGAVQVFPNAATRLPDVTDDYTNIRRQIQTNGQDNIVGIEVKADKAYRMKDTSRYEIYDSDNQPPYPVTSVNGQTGNVTVTSDVTSVNGQTGAVVLAIPFANVNIDDVLFSQAASGHEWSIGRETLDGVGSIQIRTDTSKAEAWVDFFNEDTQVTYSRKLLTTDDIPSGSGVISVNGLAGVVVISGSDIKRSSTSQESIETALANLDAEVLSQGGDITDLQVDVRNLETAVSGLSGGADGLAYIVTGDTASAAVPSGAYVYIKNNTHGLTDGYYQNTSASAFPVSGGTADSTVFTAVPAAGILNTMNTALHQYDTTERVVGSFNGQDVYEKSYYVASMTGATHVILDSSTIFQVDNMTAILSINGTVKTSGQNIFPISYLVSSNYLIRVSTSAAGLALDSVGYQIVSYFVTVRYIK